MITARRPRERLRDVQNISASMKVHHANFHEARLNWSIFSTIEGYIEKFRDVTDLERQLKSRLEQD